MRGTTRFQERRTLSCGRRLVGVSALVFVMLGPSEVWGEDSLNRITSVQLEEEGERSTLTIVGSEPPEYTIASRQLPARIIVELSNARAEGLSPRLASRTAQIAEVALGARYVEGELATRVFVYLRGTVAYQVEVEDNALVMSFVSIASEDIPSNGRDGTTRRATASTPQSTTEEDTEATTSSREASPRAVPQQRASGESRSRPAQHATPRREHVVERGEVIARIAARYGISVQELLSFNPGVNPRRLHAGQRLVVQGAETARYRVRPGEVLSQIAGRYNVTIEDLIRWNPGLSPDRIRVGSTLIVQDPSGR